MKSFYIIGALLLLNISNAGHSASKRKVINEIRALEDNVRQANVRHSSRLLDNVLCHIEKANDLLERRGQRRGQDNRGGRHRDQRGSRNDIDNCGGRRPIEPPRPVEPRRPVSKFNECFSWANSALAREGNFPGGEASRAKGVCEGVHENKYRCMRTSYSSCINSGNFYVYDCLRKAQSNCNSIKD